MMWYIKTILKSKSRGGKLRPIGQIYLFLYELWAKDGFNIFKWLGKRIFCDAWKLHEIQILMSIKFIGTQPHSLGYVLFMAVFVLQQQNRIVATETVSQSLKYLLSNPLRKKCANPCFREFRCSHAVLIWWSVHWKRKDKLDTLWSLEL